MQSKAKKLEYHRKWRIQRIKIYREKAFKLLGGSCNVCGYNMNPDGLEIDHITPKRFRGNDIFRFHSSAWWNCKWDRILKELAKCQLLCGTCHRIKTRKEARDTNGWSKRTKWKV